MPSSENFKIRFYSDSLGMPRLESDISNDRRYITRFQKYWLKKLNTDYVEFIDRAKQNNLVVDLFRAYKSDCVYFGERGDILIIHEGICDCAPRPIPLTWRNRLSTFPEVIKNALIFLLNKNRGRLLRRGLRFNNTSPENFAAYYSEWLNEAKQKFKQIYVINIAPTNENMEKHSPGLSESISSYNDIIKREINKVGSKNIHYIDVNEVFSKDISKYILDDGHHLSVCGHDMILELLIGLDENNI